MTNGISQAQRRLSQVKDILTMNKTATTLPFDPDSTKFPQRKDVPQPSYAPRGVHTAWVWGENDNVSEDDAPWIFFTDRYTRLAASTS